LNFPSLSSLRYLSLSHCNIESIAADTFQGLPNLEYLDLSFNPKLTNIAPETFLAIKQTPLTLMLHDSPKLSTNFKLKFNTLRLLDLSNCNLTKSPNEFIESNYTIENLNFSHNSLSTWNKFTSKTLRIRNVNLSYNVIQTVNMTMRNSFHAVQSVDLGGNPFDCQNCQLNDFKAWLIKPKKLRILNLGKNQSITCKYPLNMTGKTILSIDYICNENDKFIYEIGIPIGTLLVGGTILSILAYIYRFELVYTKQLWQMKRKNEKKSNQRSPDNYQFDAFVSYCAADRSWVMETLLPTLETPVDGYSLCLHERDFQLGSFIMDNIVENIEKSRRVLFVLSNNFLQSEVSSVNIIVIELLYLTNEINILTFLIFI
jgi:toll-like receptor 2